MKRISCVVLFGCLFFLNLSAVKNIVFDLGDEARQLISKLKKESKLDDINMRKEYIICLNAFSENYAIEKDKVRNSFGIDTINLIKENIEWSELKAIDLEQDAIDIILQYNFSMAAFNREFHLGSGPDVYYENKRKYIIDSKNKAMNALISAAKEKILKLELEKHNAIKNKALEEACEAILLALYNS